MPPLGTDSSQWPRCPGRGWPLWPPCSAGGLLSEGPAHSMVVGGQGEVRAGLRSGPDPLRRKSRFWGDCQLPRPGGRPPSLLSPRLAHSGQVPLGVFREAISPYSPLHRSPETPSPSPQPEQGPDSVPRPSPRCQPKDCTLTPHSLAAPNPVQPGSPWGWPCRPGRASGSRCWAQGKMGSQARSSGAAPGPPAAAGEIPTPVLPPYFLWSRPRASLHSL